MRDYIIKICGITDQDQAIKIGDMGATHIGMVYFEKSPRHLPFDKIKLISESIKGISKSVAVVVNPDYKTVEKLLEVVDMVQFHGDEKPEFVSEFPKDRIIKAFRIKNRSDIDKLKSFFDLGVVILIDAYSKTAYGGTGKQVNPDIAKSVVSMYRKTVLSGGLSPDNLVYLLESIKPYGVDASSKLEIGPGVKDLEKVKKFIKIARDFYESDN